MPSPTSTPSTARASSMVMGGSAAATWQPNAEASNSSMARVPLTPRVT
jgi:hypothetical protein